MKNETLAEYARRLKQEERERLNQLLPSTAQAEVEAVLDARAWKVKNESELIWPGDLGTEDPDWPDYANPPTGNGCGE